jgi:hypothetical protein
MKSVFIVGMQTLKAEQLPTVAAPLQESDDHQVSTMNLAISEATETNLVTLQPEELLQIR